NTRIKAIEFNSTQLANYTLTKFGSGCPPEIAIYIHGYNRDDGEAKEEFNRIQQSLQHNNYRIPLVGFSWESKVLWEIAKSNAKQSGENLSKYIIELNRKCPTTDIRIIAHSLGAAVVDSVLVSLDNSSNLNKKIASVHLLGAAINNQSIAKDTAFGKAINDIVDKFYNLYNPEDDGLKVNQLYENHQPLGLVETTKMLVPSNYFDTNVAYEIIPFSDADGNGNVEECFENIKPVQKWGDNHCGYIGFRNQDEGSLRDDGATNIVVRDWIKS
ncbi:MAG TPA: alpha/beta hydrolase, partial [Nitrososphaeraceae archaeon]|nr:alpha/beta hydrolase [Nitrososphaeraceae archaeon]